jgi:hypothetical protein
LLSAFLCASVLVRDKADESQGPEVGECAALLVSMRIEKKRSFVKRAEVTSRSLARRAAPKHGLARRFAIRAARL